MKQETNSTGGKNVTMKQSEAGNCSARAFIPDTAVVLREVTTYYDPVTRRQYVVTSEADGLEKGCLHGRRL